MRILSREQIDNLRAWHKEQPIKKGYQIPDDTEPEPKWGDGVYGPHGGVRMLTDEELKLIWMSDEEYLATSCEEGIGYCRVALQRPKPIRRQWFENPFSAFCGGVIGFLLAAMVACILWRLSV